MDEARDVPPPVDRALVEYDEQASTGLRCSNCRGEVTDADADCPTCESPIDWGASADALRRQEQASASA